MAVKEIITLGDSRLYNPAQEVTLFASALADDITDMIDTMRHYQGVGLAANQIGIDKRIMVLEVNNNPRYPEMSCIPLMVLVNPVIKFIGDSQESFWEGCLSLPGLRGEVWRHKSIEYQAYDHLGNAFSTQANGFIARIIQHECDHLNGILLHQRVKDLKKFGFEKNLNKPGC